MGNSYKTLATENLIMMLEDCLARAEYGLRSNNNQYAYSQIKKSIDMTNEIKTRKLRNERIHEMH